MPIEYKAFKGTLDTAGEGSLVAEFSVFDTADLEGDITLKSFFTDGQSVPMVHDHDWSVVTGKGVIEVGQKSAVFNGKLFLDTIAGREAYTTIRNLGDLQEYSYGYVATDTHRGNHEGKSVRFLRGGKTYEVSDTLVGAMPGTRTLGIKSGPFAGKAAWTTAYQNDLPDSAFAYIAPGGEKDADGKTTPRSLRYLPHHDADGSPDLPHVRNALARAPQADIPAAAQAKAETHLQRHLTAATKGLYITDPEIEGSYEDLAEDISAAMTGQHLAPVNASVSTIATFSSYAYVAVRTYDADEPTYYRVDYTLDDMGDPVLSNPTEVDIAVVFNPTDAHPGLTFAGQSAKALAAFAALANRTSALAALRVKSGRVLSAANHAKLTAVHDGMAAHLAAMHQVLQDHAPPPAKSADVVDEAVRADRRRLYAAYLQTEARLNGVAV